jgi:hypothetical protein
VAARARACAEIGVEVADDAWGELQQFVRRTHVPASERSRATGAGAGLIDDDRDNGGTKWGWRSCQRGHGCQVPFAGRGNRHDYAGRTLDLPCLWLDR